MFALINQNGKLRDALGLTLLSAAALLGAGHVSYAETKPKVHTVIIEAMQFSPQVLEMNIGDTVIWKNKDPFPHTVTGEEHGFDSGEIAAERSWKFKAIKQGVFAYVCTLHPAMKGSLAIK